MDALPIISSSSPTEQIVPMKDQVEARHAEDQVKASHTEARHAEAEVEDDKTNHTEARHAEAEVEDDKTNHTEARHAEAEVKDDKTKHAEFEEMEERQGGCDNNDHSANNRESNHEDVDKSQLDKAYQTLITEFKALYDTAKRDNLKTTKEETRAAIFNRIFDMEVQRYVNGVCAGGYQELLDEASTWIYDNEFVFRAFRYKRLGPDSFDKYVRFCMDQDEFIIQSKVYFDGQTAKVVKLETSRLQRRKKIPGQVSVVQDSTSCEGLQQVWSDVLQQDFARNVYPLPHEVRKQHFLCGSGTPFFALSLPVTERYEIIRILMKSNDDRKSLLHKSRTTQCRSFRNTLSRSFSSNGTLNDIIQLYVGQNIPLADGAHWKHTVEKRVLRRNSHHLVLYNSNDEPLCMC